ncbi:hypothetical protein JTE90_021956 [Oedothorax gibbosus]|uniref:Uncharacterized protein n=1 Tax=Oedothorax gibbosus TaxID=931172 RepID=A0AAV6V6B8_9ARAC|nr:hypothetical protein JTE90_021956 [Oedothorax gibbosus]
MALRSNTSSVKLNASSGLPGTRESHVETLHWGTVSRSKCNEARVVFLGRGKIVHYGLEQVQSLMVPTRDVKTVRPQSCSLDLWLNFTSCQEHVFFNFRSNEDRVSLRDILQSSLQVTLRAMPLLALWL